MARPDDKSASVEDPHKLRQLLELRGLVDDIIEEGLLARRSLAEVMRGMLPRICDLCGARGAFVQSYDEDLALSVFRTPKDLAIPDWENVQARTSDAERQDITERVGGDLLIAIPLDVAGEWFGRAGLVVPAASFEAEDPEHLHALLDIACEELDNFLFSIKAAREKHRVMMELSDALRHRVLSEGLQQAVACLARATPLDRMLLVYVAQEDSASTLHVQLFHGHTLVLDTMTGEVENGDELRAAAREWLYGRSSAFLERYGFVGAQEEVLISGVTNSVRVGKVIATSKAGQFNTYDRELLAGFSGFIRQRVVDFNKEWRRLAASFRQQDVARLLSHDDYEARFLAPHEQTVAIAYVDIAGFTRISEQILRTPSAVAKLVEHWSAQAVDLVWEHGGVFDKMVGDCVIALFGPPFYDSPPGDRLVAALHWAKAIRAMTTAFPQQEGFEPLRAEGLAVTIGVHLAPLFVGTFGPNQNFTGFSSGMNNTARLQSTAKRDEILVMAEAIEQLPAKHEFQFGEERTAQVKNVAQPIRFRALLG
ncbi:MAG: adenylate/guanylate cyclase domain-containing protein [Myxococcales bacterium]|nr:adenylate/guanylate cyclase domain-containing protein [Myxococcales bacterium]